jgi:ferredoxin-NADP reductase
MLNFWSNAVSADEVQANLTVPGMPDRAARSKQIVRKACDLRQNGAGTNSTRTALSRKGQPMTHRLTLLETLPLTSDTRAYIFTKPNGFSFEPGQATELALDRDDWREEGRPFTFTSDPDADVLGFVIKSYPERDGVTARLRSLQPGDSVLIGDAWGAIEDKGPGTFIAGGAGITPFVGILRHRERRGQLTDSSLIFANKTPNDIILRQLWESMEGLETTFVVSEGEADRQGQVDGSMLDDLIEDWSQNFYVCGPPKMVDAIVEALEERDVPTDRIIQEE